MKRFRYALDPLCVSACALYAVNRFGVKPHVGSEFLRGHFNDLLLIPAALPFVLWINRRLGWRPHDAPPNAREIALHTALWALICEGIGPRWFQQGTADWCDVVAYATGAVIAWMLWNPKSARDQTEVA